MKGQAMLVAPIRAEGMVIAVADGAPVHELDAEFEGAARTRQQLVFVYTQPLVELADGRNRGLSNANRADLVGFDQHDLLDLATQNPAKPGRGHPSRGAAAHDRDSFYGCCHGVRRSTAARRHNIATRTVRGRASRPPRVAGARGPGSSPDPGLSRAWVRAADRSHGGDFPVRREWRASSAS